MIDDDFGLEEIKQPTSTAAVKKTRNTIISNAEKGGWLKKESNKHEDKWSFRYFALIDDKLYFYKQPSDKTPKGLLDFSSTSVDLQLVPEDQPTLLIISPAIGKSLILKARDPEELEDWASVLEFSMLKNKSAPSVARIERGMAWSSTKISLYDMLSLVQTGDLIIFRTDTINTRVSLIIVYPDGEIGILQADSIDGVSIVIAEEFLPQLRSQNLSLYLRQLKVSRTNELLMKFEEFVKNFQKKKFSVSPISLLQGASGGSDEVAACSAELVASAYKAMGLLSSGVSANKYSPSDFAANKKLSLIGARLTSEVRIDIGN